MKQNPVFDRLTALADPIRARLLLVLERHELTVSELRAALQLPQSTVSRHLRALGDAGWLVSREDGTSNRYRMVGKEGDASARKLWLTVRDEVGSMATAARDAERVRGVIAGRHSTSQKFFASSAAQWDKLRAELFGSRTELFALLALLEPNATVGDLGCGAGHLAEAMAPFAGRIVAVDESTAMLRAARARLELFDNVDVRQGTLEALPIEESSLDVAILSLVLHYLAEPGLALASAFRALKEGGRLVIVDMLPHDHSEYQDTMGHVWLGFSAAQICQWGNEAGFQSIRIHTLPSSPAAKGPTLFAATLSKSSLPSLSSHT